MLQPIVVVKKVIYIKFMKDFANYIQLISVSKRKNVWRCEGSTLNVASAGVQKRWDMKREYSSMIDTADFYCLPTIRAI